MDDRDTIRRRIIDRAVELFDEKGDPSGDGLFTTAHYGQAVKAEFRTPGPTLDGATCAKHLSRMGDIVEKAGSNLWRRLARRGSPAQGEDPYSASGVESRIEAAVMQILADGAAGRLPRQPGPPSWENGAYAKTLWWSIESMNAWLGKYETEDLIFSRPLSAVLRAMVADGRMTEHPNPLNAGETVFGLATKSGFEPEFRPRPYSDVRLDTELIEIENEINDGVLRILGDGPTGIDVGAGATWWSVESTTDALKDTGYDFLSKLRVKVRDDLLENMAGLALYTMAVDGRVVAKPGTLVDGARVTVFALAPRGAGAKGGPGGRPHEGRT